MNVISILFFGFISTCSSSTVLFQRTNNVSHSSFSSARQHLGKARNVLDCGSKCVYYESSGQGTCNAYSFNDNNEDCELASMTFLEDPLHDGSDGGEKKVMVDVTVLETLPRTCRGGEHCCRPDNPCPLDSGDCNHDHDCQGVMICGTDNCPIKTGGRWDDTDDCCERRCTPDHPCREGEGHCEYDSDCINSGRRL